MKDHLKKNKSFNTRQLACQYLLKIQEKTLNLAQFDAWVSHYNLSDNDRSFLRRLVFETCRYFHYYQTIAKKFIKLNKTKKPVINLIIIGFIQLDLFDQPDYAIISETVNAAKNLNYQFAASMINAVLRNYQRHKKNNQNDKISLPNWLLESLEKDYPKNHLDIKKYLNSDADLYLRINQTQTTLDTFCEQLKSKNIAVKQPSNVTFFKESLLLDKNTKVTELPFFSEGYFSIQDLSAQSFIRLLPIKSGEKILDACAAPGGKTTYLLENFSNIHLTAIDTENTRLNKLKENISRLKLDHISNNQLNIIHSDATNLDNWWNKEAFDHVILDAPCSATGVIRRHPDIKISRTEEDVQNIIQIQKKLLNQLWKTLKNKGYLLYITCSILQSENDKQIEQFINSHSNAKIINIQIPLEGIKTNYGYQIFPKISDGFYYALIQKLD